MSAERRNVPAIVEAATPTLRSSLAVAGGAGDRGCAVVGSQSSVTTWVCGATAPWTKAWIWSLPKPSITFSRAPRLAGVDFDPRRRPASYQPRYDRVVFGAKRDDRLVSSASTMPHSGSRSGLIMARRLSDELFPSSFRLISVHLEPPASVCCNAD
jgi:hypothetical protein